MKKIFIAILIILIIAATAVFIYRYRIIQYSAENIIRRILPPYVRVDKIIFDAKASRIALSGFRILNPLGFSDKYLLEIDRIGCEYRLKGKSIMDGFEVIEPSFEKMALNIERASDGRMNLNEMKNVAEKAAPPKKTAVDSAGKAPAVTGLAGARRPSDIVKLPSTFSLKDGKVMFIDRFMGHAPHLITFEDIEAKLSITLDENYSRLLDLKTTGRGDVNGDRNQVVQWAISLNPNTPKLTMSTNFRVSGVDIPTFEPYYDKYSPFVFREGRCSGTLVFDFDNGNIGSTNEEHLSHVIFYIKRGQENTQFWETTVQDLAKYFTSASGEIVFDFKIKGDIKEPRFYLGP